MKNNVLKNIVNRIRDYGYRFTPWLMLTWKQRNVQRITHQENKLFEINNEEYIGRLQTLFSSLESKKSDETTNHVFKKTFGFDLSVEESSIENAGNGVFVKSGRIPKLSIAAMYPGTIYYPMDPILFQSLNNSYVLKCIDGVLVDGCHKGISRRIFRSCASRDRLGIHEACDTSWLNLENLQNPLAIGQIVNNATTKESVNVMYVELDIPCTFPVELLKYIPNVRFNPVERCWEFPEENVYVRTVLLISLREIFQGEELFSSYFTEVGSE